MHEDHPPSPSVCPKPHPFQFSLRTLMVAILVGGTLVAIEVAYGPVRYAYYRTRLACIDDPRQGWSRRLSIVDQMADAGPWCAEYSREAWFSSAGWYLQRPGQSMAMSMLVLRRMNDRKAALLGADRSYVLDKLGPATASSTSQDIWVRRDEFLQMRTTLSVDYDSEQKVDRMSAVEFYEASGTESRLGFIAR